MCERDLSELAEQIRAVRAAEKRFMSLWRVEQVPIGPEVLDRLAADLDEVSKLAEEFCALQQENAAAHEENAALRREIGATEVSSYRHRPRWPMNGRDGVGDDLN
jgi:hypothetical protein